jgi:hypothetical protein
MPRFRVRSAHPDDLASVRRVLEQRAGAPLPDWEAFAATAQVCSGAPGKILLSDEPDAESAPTPPRDLRTAEGDRDDPRRAAPIISFPRTGDVVANLAFLAAASRVPIPTGQIPPSHSPATAG